MLVKTFPTDLPVNLDNRYSTPLPVRIAASAGRDSARKYLSPDYMMPPPLWPASTKVNSSEARSAYVSTANSSTLGISGSLNGTTVPGQIAVVLTSALAVVPRVGQWVNIAGAANTSYNGSWQVQFAASGSSFILTNTTGSTIAADVTSAATVATAIQQSYICLLSNGGINGGTTSSTAPAWKTSYITPTALDNNILWYYWGPTTPLAPVAGCPTLTYGTGAASGAFAVGTSGSITGSLSAGTQFKWFQIGNSTSGTPGLSGSVAIGGCAFGAIDDLQTLSGYNALAQYPGPYGSSNELTGTPRISPYGNKTCFTETFYTDSTQIARTASGSESFKLWIDDRPLCPGSLITGTATTAGYAFINFATGDNGAPSSGRRVRKIQTQVPNGQYSFSYWIERSASFYPYKDPNEINALFLGDDLLNASQDGQFPCNGQDNWGVLCGRGLGWSNPCVSGINGVGYWASGRLTANLGNYASRVAAEVGRVYPGGVNLTKPSGYNDGLRLEKSSGVISGISQTGTTVTITLSSGLSGTPYVGQPLAIAGTQTVLDGQILPVATAASATSFTLTHTISQTVGSATVGRIVSFVSGNISTSSQSGTTLTVTVAANQNGSNTFNRGLVSFWGTGNANLDGRSFLTQLGTSLSCVVTLPAGMTISTLTTGTVIFCSTNWWTFTNTTPPAWDIVVLPMSIYDIFVIDSASSNVTNAINGFTASQSTTSVKQVAGSNDLQVTFAGPLAYNYNPSVGQTVTIAGMTNVAAGSNYVVNGVSTVVVAAVVTSTTLFLNNPAGIGGIASDSGTVSRVTGMGPEAVAMLTAVRTANPSCIIWLTGMPLNQYNNTTYTPATVAQLEAGVYAYILANWPEAGAGGKKFFMTPFTSSTDGNGNLNTPVIGSGWPGYSSGGIVAESNVIGSNTINATGSKGLFSDKGHEAIAEWNVTKFRELILPQLV